MSAYLGIRYAEPPFGPLRLQPPVDCDGEPTGAFGDAHTLNVWSAMDGPVLLWVHGGANTVGSSAQPEYAGDVLASLGVVFVSCNYRLAADGYGALEGFPHNRGLRDVVSALRWIQRNIARYGGDPGNVTVAGQSSGAQTVASLMVMPEAKGLFHRAIAHSLAGRFFTPDEAVEVQRAAELEVLYQPIVDGDTLPRSPLEGPYDVDLMVCHTADEDPELFQKPTERLADEHGRAFRSVYARTPAHHGADVPDMFRGDIAQAWARFARDGDPGWPREELKRWVSSPS